MPRQSKPSAAKTPNTPTGPHAGAPLDLSAYRSAPAAPSSGKTDQTRSRTPSKADRDKRDKVLWEGLVGIPDLRVIDSWEDSDDTYGDYVGTIVRIPRAGANAPQRDVLCLTSASTRAGKKLTAAHAAGTFDLLDGEGSTYVPVTVGAKVARNVETEDGRAPRPMILLHFGAVVEGG